MKLTCRQQKLVTEKNNLCSVIENLKNLCSKNKFNDVFSGTGWVEESSSYQVKDGSWLYIYIRHHNGAIPLFWFPKLMEKYDYA